MLVRRTFRAAACAALAIAAGCAMTPGASAPERFDHVVLGISDLGRGIEQLGALCGVKPVRGGQHPHTGTENALLSSGPDSYVEVLAPQAGVPLPPEIAPLRGVADLLPVSWAVATRDASRTIGRLRAAGFGVSEPQPGSREVGDGKTLRWRTFTITSPAIAGAPFFIEWDSGLPHPAASSPPGCTLQTLELRTPQDAELRRLLDLLDVPGQVVRGDASRPVVTLKGPRGPVRLPAGS